MAAPRNRPHLTVQGTPETEGFTPRGTGGGSTERTPPASRPRHGQALIRSLTEAQAEARQRREHAGFTVHGATTGLYIAFDGHPNLTLELNSLENRRSGVELVSVRQVEQDESVVEEAVVFVPESKVGTFFAKFEKYALETERRPGEIRHFNMGDSIASLRLATVEALWTDDADAYPTPGEVVWWEVWLRRRDGGELERFFEFAGNQGIELGEQRLGFDDRTVLLALAAPEQLAVSLDVLSDVAELRRAKESPLFFVDGLTVEEQVDWADDLVARTELQPTAEHSAVAILDTGVSYNHPLLSGAISQDDCHAYDVGWGSHDHHGHGTQTAGLALYGNLRDVLEGAHQIQLHHCLESVKVLPPAGHTDVQLYGAVTAEAASRVEIQAPARRRCFSMAVSAPDQRDRGRPTSWSAAVDALAAGRSFDQTTKGLVYLDDDGPNQRLFVIAAGNVVSALEVDHLSRSDVEDIHDPAQAWNALTVGACTQLTTIRDTSFAGYEPIAQAGDLSPYSTTSVTFQPAWPLKPDVVFEGGNAAHDGAGFISDVPDLSLLTTHRDPTTRLFDLSRETSAATAQVSRIAATISAAYPAWWPETIRAMVVQSAEWTPRMKGLVDGARSQRDCLRLVRRYGFGVPSLERSLRSADDALTLVSQATISPFIDGKIREMHLHEMPWPKEELEALGNAAVRLRITLSYFIEPNPARRGWRSRYRYQSHGLRFDVIRPTESVEDFRLRLNAQAQAEDDRRPEPPSDPNWLIGVKGRTAGSLHSDIWTGIAADLAGRNYIAIYPVSGWWKDEKGRDRSEQGARYSLIASLETDAVDADIWTPVAAQIGVPVEVITEIQT